MIRRYEFVRMDYEKVNEYKNYEKKEKLAKAVVDKTSFDPVIATLIFSADDNIKNYYKTRRIVLMKMNKPQLLKEFDDMWRGYPF